jgi:hypothetical protein
MRVWGEPDLALPAILIAHFADERRGQTRLWSIRVYRITFSS